MPDVTACLHPAGVRLWVSLDVHKFSIVAATLPPAGGKPEVCRIETTERAIDRLGGPTGLAIGYEAGPGGFALWRLLTSILGLACDVVAPSLVAVRAGDRVKTDRRDARKLVGLYRAGLLGFVHPPTAELEGLRDLLRCRDDVRLARMAARHRVLKQLLRHGRIYREGKTSWSLKHRRWINAQRLEDPLAQRALEQLLIHPDGIERQLDVLDAELEQIAQSERWAGQVQVLVRFRGISTLTALGLIAEIGDFARFSHPREPASWLGITPSEYSSGDQQHRGHITKAGNRHARRGSRPPHASRPTASTTPSPTPATPWAPRRATNASARTGNAPTTTSNALNETSVTASTAGAPTRSKKPRPGAAPPPLAFVHAPAPSLACVPSADAH